MKLKRKDKIPALVFLIIVIICAIVGSAFRLTNDDIIWKVSAGLMVLFGIAFAIADSATESNGENEFKGGDIE